LALFVMGLSPVNPSQTRMAACSPPKPARIRVDRRLTTILRDVSFGAARRYGPPMNNDEHGFFDSPAEGVAGAVTLH
jgi:hypothetical protein